MFIRKYFAKATLRSYEASPETSDFMINILAGSTSALVGLLLSLPAAFIFDNDQGNGNEQEILSQYEEVLNTLESNTANYNKLYKKTTPLNNDKNTKMAYITQALQNPVIEPVENIEQTQEAIVAWNKIEKLSQTFTDSLIRDPNLMESDAGDLIERFESNVMSFKDLGYKGTPDADDLRECQDIHSSSKSISQCSIDKNFGNDSIFVSGGILGILVFPILPFLLNTVVPANRKRLEKWAEGKKAPKMTH